MALTVGELNAWLRADDGPFQRGLTRARGALTGLQGDANRRLSALRGLFTREGESMGTALGRHIRRGSQTAVSAVKKVGPALAGISVGIPVAAGAATALVGIAAGAAAAGAAVRAFQLAVGPQMEAITEVSDLAAKAEEAAAEGGTAAAEAQQEYQQALADLPAPTRAAAKAFIALKSDYEDWSDSLASTTMPLFTKGLNTLRAALPALSPLVKAAAGAFAPFLSDLERSVRGGGLASFVKQIAGPARVALTNFLLAIKNIGVGLWGLLRAFLPVSGQMTGGLVDLTAKFAAWGQSLEDTEGFAQFLQFAKEGGQTLGQLALAVGNLLVALGPLIGVSTQIALALAKVVNSLPPDVLSALAIAITSVVVAMKLYAAYSKVSSAASAVFGSRVGQAATRVAGSWARAAGRAIASMARIAATAAATALRTAAAWAAAGARMTARFLAAVIRTAAVTLARFAMMAARAIAWAAVMAAQWLIAMGPVGWITAAVIALVVLIIAKWDTIKQWTAAAWTWIWTKIKQVAMFIWNLFLNWTLVGLIVKHWTAIKTKTMAAWNAIVNWCRQLPGRIATAIASLASRMVAKATTALSRFRSAVVSRALAVVAWMRGLPGRIARGVGSLGRLLYGKGKDVVRGLLNGVKSMGSWLRSQLISFAKSMVPGPIAKALGISSPSRVMARDIGRWIPAGIVKGIEGGQGAVDRTMSNLVNPLGVHAGAGIGLTGTAAGAGGAGGGQTVRVVLDVTGGDSEMKRMIRRMVRVDGRGSVQTAFGTR
ncbi:hypothetical protein ABZ820_34625 [Streptomyces diacarni]|uniref:phage tail protein n=1 Tax=Streptomyces diacarni TaxID=2800381 RepID=UPI003400596A